MTSLDIQTINYLEQRQEEINQYWSAENQHNRLTELSIRELTFENERFKKQIEKQKAEILALKKENRRLQGLPEEEPVVINVVDLDEENDLFRPVRCSGQQFRVAEEFHDVEEEPFYGDFEVEALPLVRQYNTGVNWDSLKTFDEEFRKVEEYLRKADEEGGDFEEGEVDPFRFVKLTSSYPQSSFETGQPFVEPIVSLDTFIRVGELGDDTPRRHETPNPRRYSFNC